MNGWLPVCGIALISLAAAAAGTEGLRLRAERSEGGATITAHGSAFAFGKRRLLTAAHNIDAGAVSIETAPGRWIPAKVLARDDDLDIALLATADDLGGVLKLAERDAKHGDALIISGSMRGQAVADYAGHLLRAFWRGTAKALAKIAFDHGLSGAPVLLDGKVVGMAVAGVPKDGDLDHECGLFVPVSALREFLERSKP